jgi:hypothetical protein
VAVAILVVNSDHAKQIASGGSGDRPLTDGEVKRNAGIKPLIVMPRCGCGPLWVRNAGLNVGLSLPVFPD